MPSNVSVISAAFAGIAPLPTPIAGQLPAFGVGLYRNYNIPGSYAFVVPPGVTRVRARVLGGGGSGSTGWSSSSPASLAGQDGGASSFGAFMTAPGGKGGTRPTSNAYQAGGLGGVGLGGDFNASGGQGGNCYTLATSQTNLWLGPSGGGAGSPLGLGGNGASPTLTNPDGNNTVATGASGGVTGGISGVATRQYEVSPFGYNSLGYFGSYPIPANLYSRFPGDGFFGAAGLSRNAASGLPITISYYNDGSSTATNTAQPTSPGDFAGQHSSTSSQGTGITAGCGGGGSGAVQLSPSSSVSGAGGGGGAYVHGSVDVTPGQTITITVGAGGASVQNNYRSGPGGNGYVVVEW